MTLHHPRKLGLIFAISAVLAASVVHTVYASAPTDALTFTPELTIPGLLDGTWTISPTTIAQYIRVIFIAFIWFVGILATVMVVYGGIRWVAAAGNPGRINEARSIIDNAIIGVIIALTSVVLFNTINPKLTSFQGIGLKYIPKLDAEVTDDGSADLVSVGSDYKQCDEQWGNTPYPGPSTASNACTICSSGCGPTAVATTLAHLNVSANPLTVAQYAMTIGARSSCSGGTRTFMLANTPDPSWGVQTKTVNDFSTAMNDLTKGVWMVVSIAKVPVAGHCARSACGAGICFCGNHYIVLTGKSGDRVTVSDPSRVGIDSLTLGDLQTYLARNEFYEFTK